MRLRAVVPAVTVLALAAPIRAADPGAKRPDVDRWISVGTTLRATAADKPNQFRHVQLEPGAYAALLKDGVLPDGATYAVTFYAAGHDAAEADLYAQGKEVFFGIEVLDKAHPDGRRFYNFVGVATTAQPLPPGNACAACHNAKGALQGTFAQHYPVIRRFVKP